MPQYDYQISKAEINLNICIAFFRVKHGNAFFIAF